MSKKSKLLDKLCGSPSPKDFRWDDVVSIFQQAGFEVECSGGSHYTFEHTKTGFKYFMSKTHPSGILKGYQVKNSIEALTQVGAIKGKNDV